MGLQNRIKTCFYKLKDKMINYEIQLFNLFAVKPICSAYRTNLNVKLQETKK